MLISAAANFMSQNINHFKGGDCCDLGDQGVYDIEYTSKLFGLDLSNLNRFGAMDKLYRHLNYERKFIDLKEGGLQYDLNYSIRSNIGLHNIYDLVTNHGTSEHIYNQVTCFEAIHYLTKKDGLMYHCLNCQGWADGGGLGHGFYLYQPKFVHLLAKQNDYEILDIKYSPSSVIPDIFPLTRENYPAMSNPKSYNKSFPHFSSILVLLRKTNLSEFNIPCEY